MKIIFQIFFGLVLLVSCTKGAKNDNEAKVFNVEEFKRNFRITDSLEIEKLDIENETYYSMILENFRKKAFELAKMPNPKELEIVHTDSSKIVFFQNKESFLYIRLEGITIPKQKIEFYQITEKERRLVWEESWEYVDFVSDTIMDVNGDNYFDVLTNFYPSSGCCRRNVFGVRLFDPRKKEFVKKRTIINPTFYPKEQVIRGVKYGHPREVPLYKMRWKGMNLDTIEYIYPFQGSKDTFLVTKRREIYPDRQNPPKGKMIFSLPEEYKSIKDIEWFLDY